MPFQIPENVVIGVFVLVFSLLGLIKEQWFLTNTRKGQRLTQWFGPQHGLWVLRIIFLTGAIFGALLAANLIQPMQ